MPAAVRPFSAMGVSLVAASAIALSPVAPSLPEVPSLTRDVSLAASPFDIYPLYAQEIATTARFLIDYAQGDLQPPLPDGVTLQTVLAGLVSNPSGRLQQFVAALETIAADLPESLQALGDNASAFLQAAVDNLEQGQFNRAFQNLVNLAQLISVTPTGLIPAVAAPLLGEPLAAALESSGLLGVVSLSPFIASGPAVNAIGWSAEVAQQIVDAARAGDADALATAIIQGPAVIGRGVVLGGYGGFGPYETPGLLSPPLNVPGPAFAVIQVGQVAKALINPPSSSNFVAKSAAAEQQPVNADKVEPRKLSTPRLLTGASNKFEPGKAGVTAGNRPGQRVTTAVQGVSAGINDSINRVRDTVKKLTGGGKSDTAEKTPSADSDG